MIQTSKHLNDREEKRIIKKFKANAKLLYNVFRGCPSYNLMHWKQ
jgi:hypothetical protein